MKTVQIFVPLFAFLLAVSTLATAQTPAQNRATMMKVYDAINGKNFDAFGRYLADNFVEYAAPEPVKGKDPSVESLREYLKAFPDFKITVDKMVAEGNTVMTLVTVTGTWQNDFMGMAPTNKAFKIQDVDIVDFDASGKATAHWTVQDPMVMMSQISK